MGSDFATRALETISFGMSLKKTMLERQLSKVRAKCPAHDTPRGEGPWVHGVLAGRKQHLHMYCDDSACHMRMME